MNKPLAELLKNCECAEFWRVAHGYVGAEPDRWPLIVVAAIERQEEIWLSRHRVDMIRLAATQYACVFYEGQWWCVKTIHYVRAAQPDLENPSILNENAGVPAA